MTVFVLSIGQICMTYQYVLRNYAKIVSVFLKFSFSYEIKFVLYNIKFMTVIITVVYLMRLRFIKLCTKRTDNRKYYIDAINSKS